MKTRHDLFNHFLAENQGLPQRLLESVFKSTSDSELAKVYGLKVLRRGYFV